MSERSLKEGWVGLRIRVLAPNARSRSKIPHVVAGMLSRSVR